MTSGGRWQVVVHERGHMSWSVMAGTLRAQCGMTETDARAAALRVGQTKRAIVVTGLDLGEAETMAAVLLRHDFVTTLENVT